jgi:hypothetical protein
MFDRFLSCALNVTILGMITVVGGIAVLLTTNGLLDLMAARVASGSVFTASGAALAACVYRLCRHRHDLAYT